MRSLDHILRSQLLLQYLCAIETQPMETGASSFPPDPLAAVTAGAPLPGLSAPQEA